MLTYTIRSNADGSFNALSHSLSLAQSLAHSHISQRILSHQFIILPCERMHSSPLHKLPSCDCVWAYVFLLLLFFFQIFIVCLFIQCLIACKIFYPPALIWTINHSMLLSVASDTFSRIYVNRTRADAGVSRTKCYYVQSMCAQATNCCHCRCYFDARLFGQCCRSTCRPIRIPRHRSSALFSKFWANVSGLSHWQHRTIVCLASCLS